MGIRKIQSQSLPNDWLQKVEDFNINKSSLSNSQKTISSYIKKYILREKNISLTDPLSLLLIKYIVLNQEFTPHYDNLPIKLIINAMDELGTKKGLEFSKKLHSIFIEFMTYQQLNKHGYKITNFIREKGSCDLSMEKNGVVSNFEVKFKENDDISLSRLYDILDGYSLLQENRFIRNKFIEINLKVQNINTYKKQILNEINQFLKIKIDLFDGKYIQIFDSKNRTKLNRDIYSSVSYINQFVITNGLQSILSTKLLIKKLFIGNDRHITNMINKSKRIDNFVGCLHWSIPFHNSVDFKIVELSFRELLNLDFDLYIYMTHITEGEYNFIIKKQYFSNNSFK